MQITEYSDINDLLNDLLSQIQKILDGKLIGFYLYGSLASGGFDYTLSDIDLLAVLSSDLNDKEFAELEKMHKGFVDDHKEWDDRIEVQYLSEFGLKTYRTQVTKMAVISPGETLHWVNVDMPWLMNWYLVQEHGMVLFGPDPETFIDSISKQEFIQAVKDHARDWREYVVDTKNSKGYQSYAILTLCRAFYTIRKGRQVSKKQAAGWAKKELPEWSYLIDNALDWREAKVDASQKESQAAYPETKRFINYVIDRIVE